jgi:hypothetical protein
VVILIFIFLTPKSWFSGSERPMAQEHQTRVSTVLLEPEPFNIQEDRPRIENRVRALTGRVDVQVVGYRELRNADGSCRGFEVDIR